ncbi:hypothetical protein StoSoilB5_19130 [Arthrobacter sp. StoSoilB5]|nr:hypothetical protein StoSoilB5_19130 [Arthrobacter sp. StoSoilB5]
MGCGRENGGMYEPVAALNTAAGSAACSRQTFARQLGKEPRNALVLDQSGQNTGSVKELS